MKYISIIALIPILSLASFVAKQDLNVRATPSLDANIVKVHLKGDSIDVIKKLYTRSNGTWYQTNQGYVSVELLSNTYLKEFPTVINATSTNPKKVYVKYIKDLPIYEKTNSNSKQTALLKANTTLDVECEITNKNQQYPWYKTTKGYIQSPYLYNPGLITNCSNKEIIHGNFEYAKLFENEIIVEKVLEEKQLQTIIEKPKKQIAKAPKTITQKDNSFNNLFVGVLLNATSLSTSNRGNVSITTQLDDNTIGYNLHIGTHYTKYLDFILNYDYTPYDDTTLSEYYLSANYRFNNYLNPYLGVSLGISELKWEKDPLTNSDTKDNKSRSKPFFGLQGGIEHTYTKQYSILAQLLYQKYEHNTNLEVGNNSAIIKHKDKFQLGVGIRYLFGIR